VDDLHPEAVYFYENSVQIHVTNSNNKQHTVTC